MGFHGRGGVARAGASFPIAVPSRTQPRGELMRLTRIPLVLVLLAPVLLASVLLAPIPLAPVGAALAQTPAPGAATTTGTATPAPAPPKPAEPRTLPLAQGAVGMILGRQVVDSQGTHVGRLVDFVVSQSGAPLAGVIDVGGFMGIGTVRVAVAWRLLRFRQELADVQVVVDMLRDEIASGPEFRGLDGGVVLVGRSPE